MIQIKARICEIQYCDTITELCLQEERFLFPVYPMICLAGAIAVDVIQKLYFFIRTKLTLLHISYHYLQYTVHITLLAVLMCGFLGISRSLAIYKGMKTRMTKR